MKTAQKVAIVPWSNAKHLYAALSIEQAAFTQPWSEDMFLSILAKRDYGAIVAERGDRVCGFLIFRERRRIGIVNMATLPRREGIGTQLVDRLKRRLQHQRRRCLEAIVSDHDLRAQVFFRAQGFRATLPIVHDGGREWYHMEYCRI